MAYIYKIINDINQKIYIGKTEFSIEKRFKEHCRDAFKRKNEKRPLYSAMKKYGIEHFSVQLVEETDNPEEREQYWIQYYNSYHNGYNATLGGDGKSWLELPEKLIIEDYNINNYSVSKLVKKYHCDKESIKKILRKNHIEIRNSSFYLRRKVAMIDMDTNEIIKIYNSIGEAEGEHPTGKQISRVCKGTRKSAGGYYWKYID